MTGSYSNCFLIQNTLTKTGVTIEARDDVREPRICAVSSQPMIPAHESKSRLANTHANVGITQPNAAISEAMKKAAAAIKIRVVNHKIEVHTCPSAPSFPISFVGCAAQVPHFVVVLLQTVAYRNKVLRVAWHPRLNAVAVAGLYKLYLYQTKPPQS